MSFDFSVMVGREQMRFNSGYLAKQADGAVAVTLGENIVFATAVAARTVKEGQDFFPLTVDYREKYYAAGKFPGGFIKREGRPSDREVLTSRLTDRPLRPLFPKDFIHEVQIIIYVLSSNGIDQPDVLAINAASAAVSISGIPFKGPVGAVRIGRIGTDWIINPTFEESAKSDIDLVVAGTKNAVLMIEGSAKNLSEDEMIQAVETAHAEIKKICQTIEQLKAAVTKKPVSYKPFITDQGLDADLRNGYYREIENLITIKDKKEREYAFDAIVERAAESLKEKYPDTIGQVRGMLDGYDREIMRRRILENGQRADGRTLTEIRPIDIMVGLLPRAHGSAVFTRGQTQSLGIVTLGTSNDAQKMDGLEGESKKNFMLHYNFPPFSVGEVGRTGGTGRREIGHGMLAERALEYCLPNPIDFPYTIRLVSEILESNGSSSMATVCSGSLSMFNAGVPCKASVAGIAMGLVKEDDRYAILSDIMGLEDHCGDMDFKVAGTSTGITAFQMDIKIEGITPEIMRVALNQAREGRLHILDKMNQVLPQPEKTLSQYVPKMYMIKVEQDKIGEIIGPGGKNIKSIVEESGAEVYIENDGTCTISAMKQESIDKAVKRIRGIIEDIEVGKVYTGVVKKIMEYGAFIEVLPGKEGLLHISNIDHKRVKAVTDVLSEGDEVLVKVIKIDKMGRVDLSRKEAM